MRSSRRSTEDRSSSFSRRSESISLKAPKAREAVDSSQVGIKVGGVEDVLVRLAKCCTPVPGDPIVGYISLGRGITIHRHDCPNARALMRNPERVLTRTMIAEHVWDYDFDSMTNVIDVYVNYLRKKIQSGGRPKLIHTIRGVGYVMKAESV